MWEGGGGGGGGASAPIAPQFRDLWREDKIHIFKPPCNFLFIE